jgi:predicted metal-dependent hydrolase
MNKTTIEDPEFGTISVLRSRTTRYVRVRIGHNGRLSATLPQRASLQNIHTLIDESRVSLRDALAGIQAKQPTFHHGQHLGSSHTIQVQEADTFHVRVKSPYVHVGLPKHMDIDSSEVQSGIAEVVKKALTIEAKAYLPRRLRYLADTFGFTFQKIRFSSASTRWGSCSSQGTISVNVWLMQLPLELVDYVLVHELCHTREMNHSADFWALLEQCDPDYGPKRKALKGYHPYV